MSTPRDRERQSPTPGFFSRRPARGKETPADLSQLSFDPLGTTEDMNERFQFAISVLRKGTPAAERTGGRQLAVFGVLNDFYTPTTDLLSLTDDEAIEHRERIARIAFGRSWDEVTPEDIDREAIAILTAKGVKELPTVSIPVRHVISTEPDDIDDEVIIGAPLPGSTPPADRHNPDDFVRPDGNIDWGKWAKRGAVAAAGTGAVAASYVFGVDTVLANGAIAAGAALEAAAIKAPVSKKARFGLGALGLMSVLGGVAYHADINPFDNGSSDHGTTTAATASPEVTPGTGNGGSAVPDKPQVPVGPQITPPKTELPAVPTTGNIPVQYTEKLIDSIGADIKPNVPIAQQSELNDHTIDIKIVHAENQQWSTFDWSQAIAFRQIGINLFDGNNPVLNGDQRWQLTTLLAKSMGVDPTALNKVYFGDTFKGIKITSEIIKFVQDQNVEVPQNILKQAGLLSLDASGNGNENPVVAAAAGSANTGSPAAVRAETPTPTPTSKSEVTPTATSNPTASATRKAEVTPAATSTPKPEISKLGKHMYRLEAMDLSTSNPNKFYKPVLIQISSIDNPEEKQQFYVGDYAQHLHDLELSEDEVDFTQIQTPTGVGYRFDNPRGGSIVVTPIGRAVPGAPGSPSSESLIAGASTKDQAKTPTPEATATVRPNAADSSADQLAKDRAAAILLLKEEKEKKEFPNPGFFLHDSKAFGIKVPFANSLYIGLPLTAIGFLAGAWLKRKKDEEDEEEKRKKRIAEEEAKTKRRFAEPAEATA